MWQLKNQELSAAVRVLGLGDWRWRLLLVQGVGPITSPLRGMVFLGWLTVISHQKDRDKCLLSLSSTFLPSTWKEWEEMVSELPTPRAEVGWFTVWEIHGALVTVGGTETGASTGPQEFFALCPLHIALPTTARPLSGWEWRYGYVSTWILSLRFCSFSFLVTIFLQTALFLLYSCFILSDLFPLFLFHGPAEGSVAMLNSTLFLKSFKYVICVFTHICA